MSISHFHFGCIVVVNTLHSAAVTQNLDINGLSSDWRTLTGLYLRLNGVTLPRLPPAYLRVMEVTEGRELGGVVVRRGRGGAAPPTLGPICQDPAGGQGISLSGRPPDCSVFLE